MNRKKIKYRELWTLRSFMHLLRVLECFSQMKGGECDKNGLNFCLVVKGFFLSYCRRKYILFDFYFGVSINIFFAYALFLSTNSYFYFIKPKPYCNVSERSHIINNYWHLQLRLAALSYCNMRFFRSYKLMAVWIDKYVMFKVLQICNIPHSFY